MLEANVSLETDFSLYVPPAALPGGPRKAICFSVRFAGPAALLSGWMNVHILDSKRVGRWHSVLMLFIAAIVTIGLIAAIGIAQLHQVELFARTPSVVSEPDKAAGAPELRNLDVSQGLWSALKRNAELQTQGYWIRTVSIAAGLPMLIIGVLGLLIFRRSICRIYLIVLAPHEPFPVIDRLVSRSGQQHVFAIRALGRDVRERFFQIHDDPALASVQLTTSTLQVTHAHCSAVKPPHSSIELHSVWALIRYAIGLMLPPQAGGKARAMHFTYKLHEVLFLVYFLMLGAALLLPAVGWVTKAESSQFPLVMAGLGVAWAFMGLVAHHRKSGHLAEWERLTAGYPFRGCPLFRYSEADNPSGQWALVEAEDFETPIRSFGLDYSTMQQLVLGVMLVSYFTVLQIVK